MEVSLEIKNGPFAGKKIALPDGQVLAVGRTSRANFAIPHDSFLSGVHFAVECTGATVRLLDRKSANGTFLNGRKVMEAMVRDGDEILAGETTFVVRIADARDTPPPTPRAQAAIPSPATTPGASGVLKSSDIMPGPAAARASRVPRSSRATPRPAAAPASAAVRSALAAPAPARPALAIGHWSFGIVPEGWEMAEGFGIRHAAKGAFPSEAMVSEDRESGATTLAQYVESQLAMLSQLISEPQIERAGAATIAGADEATEAMIRYRTDDGRRFVQRQIFARAGGLFGVLTLTCLEDELGCLRPVFDRIVSAAAFNQHGKQV